MEGREGSDYKIRAFKFDEIVFYVPKFYKTDLTLLTSMYKVLSLLNGL